MTAPTSIAEQAASVSGLPSTVTQAWLQQEGVDSSYHNPFAVTVDYAHASGTGIQPVGSINSVGVASFANDQDGIAVWWAGIQTESNYATAKKLAADPNSTVASFYGAISDAGYGGSSGYGAALNNVFQQNTGTDPNAVLLGGGSAAGTVLGVQIPNPFKQWGITPLGVAIGAVVLWALGQE